MGLGKTPPNFGAPAGRPPSCVTCMRYLRWGWRFHIMRWNLKDDLVEPWVATDDRVQEIKRQVGHIVESGMPKVVAVAVPAEERLQGASRDVQRRELKRLRQSVRKTHGNTGLKVLEIRYLDGPQPWTIRQSITRSVMKEFGWQTLRGRGRGPKLKEKVEYYLRLNERLNPDVRFRRLPNRPALPVDETTLHELVCATERWLGHFRKQPNREAHLSNQLMPDWCKQIVEYPATDAGARRSVAHLLGISPRSLNRATKRGQA